MKRVCAWCAKDMGSKPSKIQSESIITHGICEECSNKNFNQLGVELTVFLDRLSAPVVVVSDTGSVKTANSHARAILQKDLADIIDYQGGDVFECAYAKLPEGCGNTIHCSGCTIRRTVMDTYESGKSHLRKPAFLNHGLPDDYKRIELLVSTEKVNNVVLLRIDKVGGNEKAQPRDPGNKK